MPYRDRGLAAGPANYGPQSSKGSRLETAVALTALLSIIGIVLIFVAAFLGWGDVGIWAGIGLFFGAGGLSILLNSATEKTCPHCKTRIPGDAKACKACGRDV